VLVNVLREDVSTGSKVDLGDRSTRHVDVLKRNRAVPVDAAAAGRMNRVSVHAKGTSKTTGAPVAVWVKPTVVFVPSGLLVLAIPMTSFRLLTPMIQVSW
jgi:hypothetical protein